MVIGIIILLVIFLLIMKSVLKVADAPHKTNTEPENDDVIQASISLVSEPVPTLVKDGSMVSRFD